MYIFKIHRNALLLFALGIILVVFPMYAMFQQFSASTTALPAPKPTPTSPPPSKINALSQSVSLKLQTAENQTTYDNGNDSSPPTNTPTPSIDPKTTPSVTPTGAITPTPGAEKTILKLNIHVTGIGSKSTDGENAAPKHVKLSVDVVLTGTDNKEAGKTTVDAVFNSATFAYETSIPLSLNAGSYIVKVRLPNTLWRTIPGFVLLTSKSTTTATVTLINGDINGDNALNLDDYNLVFACVGAKPACTSTIAAKTDLNDDGATDILDINILLKSFAVRSGD